MRRGLLDQGEQPMGLMGGLQNAFENPMMLGGLSLLSGGGWGGAFQGMRTGAGLQDRRREQEQQAQQQQQFRSALDALGEMPPAERALLEAAGVNSAPAFLKHLMDQRDPARQLEMEYKRAQIANLQRQAQAGPDNPSSVREWEYYNSLSPEDQRRYLGMKRAQQFLDTGTGFVPVDPTSPGGTGPVIEKDLAGAAALKAEGKAQGEAAATYRSMTSKMRGLEAVVKRLDELSEKATYTMAGRALDTGMRELGMEPRESAIARSEYTAVVDNQILPLLRDTFGAQFTQKEGETLRATLGDANKSPKEKQALLRAFIEQKRRDIEALALQAMRGDQPQAGGSGPVVINGYKIEAE